MDIEITKERLPKRKKYVVFLVSVCVLLGLVLIFFNARHDQDTKNWEWFSLEHGNLIDSTIGSGNFISKAQRLISSDEPGIIEFINKRPGENVTAGEILFQLKNPQLAQEVEAAAIEVKKANLEFEASQETTQREILDAELALSQAKIDVRIAEADLMANRTLMEKNVISKLRFGQFEAASMKALNQAEAAEKRLAAQKVRAVRLSATANQTLQLAQLKSKRLEERFQNLKLRSPIAGIVKKLVPQLGDAVTPGRPLAEVGPLTADGVRLRLPQRELSRLTPELPVKLTFNNQETMGKILRVEPDPRDGYVLVEVTANLPDTARVDMVVQGEVQFGKLAQACYIRTLRTLEPGQSKIDVRRMNNGKTTSTITTHARVINGHLVFENLDCKQGDKIAMRQ